MAKDAAREEDVRQAINRALAAERDATAAVARCEQAAAATVEAARADAEQVRRRADLRVASLHERHGRQRERAIDARLHEGTRPAPRPDPHLEEERLRQVVARLAARLSGEEPR